MPDNPTYLTPQQVASKLRLRSVRTIYNYLARGEFPNAKRRLLGWIIPETDVEHFLDKWTRKE